MKKHKSIDIVDVCNSYLGDDFRVRQVTYSQMLPNKEFEFILNIGLDSCTDFNSKINKFIDVIFDGHGELTYRNSIIINNSMLSYPAVYDTKMTIRVYKEGINHLQRLVDLMVDLNTI